MSAHPKQTPNRPALGAAARVGAGIFTSRVFGLVRDAVVLAFFGVGPHADVFRSAFRAPNVLQNLLGEQTLSAAFIPIYSRLLGQGRREDAGRFAGAIFGMLLAAVCAIALAGVFFARPLVAVFTFGYLGDAARVAAGEAAVDRFELAVIGVRILFPGAAFLALAAWTLGVLNSHRKFFLPYFAPVLWNAAIIAALLYGYASFTPAEGSSPEAQSLGLAGRILIAAFWGGLIGGLLQFLIQVPAALRALTGFRVSLSRSVEGVGEALSNVVPVMAARGAAQLSSYVDVFLASLLVQGAVSGLGTAQVLYLLPISLFALSVAAAELPELSRGGGSRGDSEKRMLAAIRRITFFVVPTQVGYLAFGFLIIGGLYRRGQFEVADNWLVYFVLTAYALGLLATAWSRMLTNVFYASGDTRTPARIAVARISISLVLGTALMVWLDRFDVQDIVAGVGSKGDRLRLGAVGLAAASAVSAWFEWLRLRSRLKSVLAMRWPSRFVGGSYARSLAALALGTALWFTCRSWDPLPAAMVVVSGYALAYLGLAALQRVPEVRDITSLLGRRNRGEP